MSLAEDREKFWALTKEEAEILLWLAAHEASKRLALDYGILYRRLVR